MIKRIVIALWLVMIALFLSITAYYIIFHHVSPMSRDQWHMLHPLLENGLWQTSITTMSGHRHILAFLLYDIDLHFFHGNNYFLVAVDWLLNISLIAVICQQIRRCLAHPYSQIFLMGWTVLLLCWLLNIALLGWGFNGINNYLSIFNTVLSIIFLHHAVYATQHKMRNAVIAILLAGLATLSFGNGILVWPIGLLSLYLWRAPLQLVKILAAGMVLFLALYLMLPGGGAVGEALRFNGWDVVLFPLELMGGPFYHLLRGWRLLPESVLPTIANGFGALVGVLSCMVLWQRMVRRVAMDSLDAVAITLILIGYGTTFLLTLTRVEGVLDPVVDRFQIWVLLVWLGLSLLLYRSVTPVGRRGWHVLVILFPLLALPAQLDWGARLAEYRTRVDNALLAYRVYLPVADDAEKALHWNWQNKLPHLFPVLEYLRANQLNIFSDGSAAWLGKPIPDVTGLPACQWSLVRQDKILAADLLQVSAIPGAEAYEVTGASPEQQVGLRWYANMGANVGGAWDAGLIADSSGVVRGLFYPVQHSVLPRFSGLIHDEYNAYGIARLEQPASQFVLLEQGRPICTAALE
jgi:hypothetical protein